MTKIFISHASEDKKDFVRPLAEKLDSMESYDVWYDEYELTWGDSLLKKINEGLSTCDFAIVVFSKHFFKKDWPQDELDGLFTLEKIKGKLILPIWKDIDFKEVAEKSPILAQRKAIKASDGIRKIISELNSVVEASNRTREIIDEDSYLEDLSTSLLKSKEISLNKQKLQTHTFVKPIRDEGETIVEKFSEKMEAILLKIFPDATNKQQSEKIPNRAAFSVDFIINQGGLKISCRFQNRIANTANEATITCQLSQIDKNFRRFEPEYIDLVGIEYKPFITISENIQWLDTDNLKATPINSQALIKIFIKELTKGIKEE